MPLVAGVHDEAHKPTDPHIVPCVLRSSRFRVTPIVVRTGKLWTRTSNAAHKANYGDGRPLALGVTWTVLGKPASMFESCAPEGISPSTALPSQSFLDRPDVIELRKIAQSRLPLELRQTTCPVSDGGGAFAAASNLEDDGDDASYRLITTDEVFIAKQSVVIEASVVEDYEMISNVKMLSTKREACFYELTMYRRDNKYVGVRRFGECDNYPGTQQTFAMGSRNAVQVLIERTMKKKCPSRYVAEFDLDDDSDGDAGGTAI